MQKLISIMTDVAGADRRRPFLPQSHGNFCEYAWGGLLLLGLAELQGVAGLWLLHLIGATLTTGRVLYSIASSVPIAELKVQGNSRVYARIHGACSSHSRWLRAAHGLKHCKGLFRAQHLN